MAFRTGNIVKHPTHGILIVVNVKKDTTEWVSGTSSNSCGTTPNEDYPWRGSQNVEYDEEEYEENKRTIINPGFNKCIKLADNLKDYIINSLTKNFNF